jgi:hypothetical protein
VLPTSPSYTTTVEVSRLLVPSDTAAYFISVVIPDGRLNLKTLLRHAPWWGRNRRGQVDCSQLKERILSVKATSLAGTQLPLTIYPTPSVENYDKTEAPSRAPRIRTLPSLTTQTIQHRLVYHGCSRAISSQAGIASSIEILTPRDSPTLGSCSIAGGGALGPQQLRKVICDRDKAGQCPGPGRNGYSARQEGA